MHSKCYSCFIRKVFDCLKRSEVDVTFLLLPDHAVKILDYAVKIGSEQPVLLAQQRAILVFFTESIRLFEKK